MIGLEIIVRKDKIWYRLDTDDADIGEASLTIAYLELAKKQLLELLEKDEGEGETKEYTPRQN